MDRRRAWPRTSIQRSATPAHRAGTAGPPAAVSSRQTPLRGTLGSDGTRGVGGFLRRACNVSSRLPFHTPTTHGGFMIKHLFLAGLLTVGASAAYAQQATTPPRTGDPQVAAMPSGADAKKL